MKESLKRFISDGTPERVAERYAALKERALQADFGPFSSNVVVIDTETTGLSFAHDELTQIAAARMEHGQITDWFVTFVNPGKPIPEEISHLTNIYAEDVEDAPTPFDALAQLVEFVGDAVCVAHNAEFDKTFTTKHPSGYPLLDNVWVDSLDLARIALPRLKSHRLIDLVTAFKLPISTHRADADVEATCAALPILLAAVEAMPPALVKKISEFATVEEWSTSAVFSYFAQKCGENSAESTALLPEAEKETSSADAFNLRELRKQNLATRSFRLKHDAEELAVTQPDALQVPRSEEIEQAFTETGIIGALYDGFERREEQVRMAHAVRTAFERSEHLVVEAGTGVGKSMAYLLPAAWMAKRSGVSVGVATKTNALLDQLIYHELPALSTALGGLTYAPLKGFSHYPCLRKIDGLVQSGKFERTVGDKQTTCAPALAALISFVEQTDYDDMDALKIDFRTLPRWSITSTSQECLRNKCPYFGQTCMVHGARKFAACADIVVTNHSLLFCDIAADGGLLPPIRHWVIDEAHGAESEARSAFSCALDSVELQSIAAKVSSDESQKNPFIRLSRRVAADVPDSQDNLVFALTNKACAAGKAFAEAVSLYVPRLKELLFFDTAHNKNYEYVDLWINDAIRAGSAFESIKSAAQGMASAAEQLITACQNLVALAEDYPKAAAVQREIAVIALKLKELGESYNIIFNDMSDQYAFSATLSHKKDRYVDKLEALPLNMGFTLEEKLFQRMHSIIFTSATLAVGESFASFENALGLNQSEYSSAKTLQLASGYDFDANMTIYVPNDMPEPNDRSYMRALVRLLQQVHLAQQGSMLTLFTNRREMESAFDEVAPVLKAQDLRLICQRRGVSVKGLRDDFIADQHLSLFALKNFWEGFDAPGATLRGVVIPKLPFSKPSDPLSCERAARDSEAWRHYVLPAAVIEMKQAAGRLIRTSTDSGILILADKRLLTKNYGKVFLNSMPSHTVKVLSIEEIAADIAAHRD